MSIPTDPAGDEEDDSRKATRSHFPFWPLSRRAEAIVSVVIGFIGAPLILSALYLLGYVSDGRLANVVTWFSIAVPVASLVMLSWPRTRLFGLGAVLFFGLAWLVFLSICGPSLLRILSGEL